MIIDLRSDTVTRPTAAMKETMFNAPLGDDVYGDDPTVNKLQQTVATYFGMEDALFFPSGTMANQVAIKAHTRPGEEIICDHTAHIYRYEGGGIAFHSGCSVRLLSGPRGIFTADDLRANINPDDVHFPDSSLAVIENTVNKGGGICWSADQISSVSDEARRHGLGMHLDGARLWNALVATQQDPVNYSKWFDSISVCFSKGLGCPAGSVLVGNRAFIASARKHRKRFGGGMRQAGFLAAACIYALSHNVERLAEDHAKAKFLEQILKNSGRVQEVMPVETNIVLFRMDSVKETDTILAHLKELNILASGTGNGWIRLVTHLDITDQMMNEMETALRIILK